MQLTPADIELLRTRPQTTSLYLSIFQPVAIFKAQVNAGASPVAKGSYIIPFNTVSLGLYTYIQEGMTMWVGTTPGGMEVGKIRVRSATSTTITVSENSDIVWANGLYLTVFRYWELWPVYPRIIQNPANLEDVIFYKDYDIPYSNQNSILGTYTNAGPHRASLLDPASGQAQIYYSSTGTYNLLGNSLNYNWFFEGATVTGSSSANPGYITYNTPGHYVTRLSVSGSSGAVDTTYRYVSIYNSANPPITKWTLDGLQGSRGEGGYTASIKVFETIPIQEHAVVVIFGKNEYGSTQRNLGGNFPNAGDILFVGYVDKDSISYDYQHSEVSFDAASLTAAMQKSSGFGVSVKSVLSPTRWYELLDMDGRRALYHYLRWHTTALSITDFQFVGDDKKIQYYDSDRGSMYDAIHNYMQNTLVGSVVSDRQGKVWMEIEAMAYPDPTGTFTPKMNITTRDWMNSPAIEERLTDDVSYMEWGGVAYSGVNTGTFDPIISEAPGTAPGFYGTIDSHQGLALINQSQLNRMTGNVFANRNSSYPTIGLDMSINAGNLDIAPQETAELHIAPSDTVRNVAIDGLYITDSISWKYNPKGLSLLPTVDMKELVNGNAASTVIIPPVENIGEGLSVSTWNMPPFPDLGSFSTVPSDSGDGAPREVLVHDPTAGWILTKTFNTPSPAWYQINAGLTTAQYQLADKVVICPNGAAYMIPKGSFVSGENRFIARADYLGGFWTVVMTEADLVTLYGSGARAVITDLVPDPNYPEQLCLAISASGAAAKVYLGSGNSWTLKQTTSDWGGDHHGSLTIAGTPATWVLTGNSSSSLPLLGVWYVYNELLSVVIRSGRFSAGTIGVSGGRYFHVRNKDKIVAYENGGDNSLSMSENLLITVTDAVAAGFIVFSSTEYLMGKIAISYNGLYLCAQRSGSTSIRSFDGGYSWSSIANLPTLVGFHFDNDSYSPSMWIAGASYMYYTADFWNSFPIDKQGNLVQINALYSLNFVKVILH